MNESGWSRLSSIAELVSSVAVVITLIYLAVQTSQNTAATQAAARQASLDNELWYLQMQIENPFLLRNPILPYEDAALTEQQIKQEHDMFIALFRMRENLYFQYRSGVLDEDSWNSYFSVFVGFLNQGSNMRRSWESVSLGLNPDFVSYVEEAISSGPP